jgi:hypothetical protein
MALNTFRSVYFPYCLQKVNKGKYVVLNREYKPLGFKTNETINYEDYPIIVQMDLLSRPTFVEKISHNKNPNNESIYLYDDGCIPTHSEEDMEKYLKRLALLASLKLK